MGFYGNITNTSRTQFQFDKVYSNRKAMEQATLTDHVYLGRYVLVEYDNDGLDGMKEVVLDDGKYYYGAPNDRTLLTWANTYEGEVVYQAFPSSKYIFYRRDVKPEGAVNNAAATFTQFTSGTEDTYGRNYNIDNQAYKSSRGYDSTVWQKTYVNETEKYVMIAELNTIVPKFDIATDAPTMVPVAPHFDTQSTDVYYKLHMQNPWIVRVAEAKNGQNSDASIEWQEVVYDETQEVGNQYSIDTVTKDGAIYFNKAAFDNQVGQSTIAKKVGGENKITIDLVSSGLELYDDHNNTTANPVAANDIQELTINLPAIGNMMSDAWDIIHGPNRDNARTDANSSLQGRLDSFKEIKSNQIPVKRVADGTLVGSMINSARKYDLWNEKPSEILEDDGVTPEFVRDDAWIETVIDTSGLAGGVKNGDAIDQSNNSGISIHHTFHATENSVSTVDKNTHKFIAGEQFKEEFIRSSNKVHINDNEIDLYVPYVDAKGHVVGHNIETITLPYSYRFFETNAITDIDDKDLYTTINSDINGNNTSEVNATNSSLTADQTQDTFSINPGNKWVQLKLDDNSDTLTIAHEIHAVDEVAQASNLNTDEVESALVSDKLTIQDIEFDAAGHVTMNRPHTYTLPYGFKTITIADESTGTDEVAAAAGSVIADNTQDTLTLTPGNKWIHIGASDTDNNDIITLSHEVNTITTNAKIDTDLNDGTDTITIQDTQYDNAGHVTHNQSHTYILPYGYKTFKDSETTPGQSIANSTQDTMILQGDTWVKPTVSNDLIKINHIGPVTAIHTSKVNVTPKFGDNFTIEDHYYDDKGHIYTTETHTVTIPKGSLSDADANGADVITQLDFTDSTGALKTTRTNIGNLKMTGYELPTSVSTEALSANESLNTVLGKLEYRLNKEIADRTTAINNLDYTDTADNTQIITEITQEDGKITKIERAAAGTLVLGSEYSKPTTGGAITTTDSLNSAFGKIEKNIDNVNNRITNLIGGEGLNAAFDTLKEVADWLESNDSDADKVIDNIATLNGTVETKGSVAHSIKQAIDTLDVADTIVEGEYVSSVSETDGKISVTRAALPTLQTGTSNGTIKLSNGTNVSVYGLQSAAYTESSAYATAAQGIKADGAIQETQKFKCGEEEKTVAELFEIIALLQEELAQLKAKVETEHPTPTEPDSTE